MYLSQLLENGTIKDNSVYQKLASQGNTIVSVNYPYNIDIIRRGRRNRKKINDEEALWHFMVQSHLTIKEIFADKKLLSKQLIMLGGEYEHNTSDPLFDLSGAGFENWTIKTGNVIGFISGKSKRYTYSLRVSSRFGDNFLKALIADADGFLEVEDFGGSGEQSDMEWLLIYFWKIKLKKAYRLGIPKSYQSKNEVLPKLRGKINILDYALLGQHTAQYKCNYREHSFANPVNQLINSVFHKLQKSILLRDAIPIRRAFETAVQGKKITLRDLHKVQSIQNPYYHPYNEVIDLSRKLLRDEFSDFATDADTNALFFDVSMLFEYFIRKIILREGVFVHEKNESGVLQIPSGGNYNKGNRNLYPDLVYDDESGCTHVFDVKYKRYDFTYGVKREDLFQIHTYLGQVSNTHKVVRCGLIYPIKAKDFIRSPISQSFLHQGKQVLFEVHFFKIPEDGSKNYKTEFKKYKEEFLCKLLMK